MAKNKNISKSISESFSKIKPTGYIILSMGVLLIVFGFLLLSYSTSDKIKNSNSFEIPPNPDKGSYTLYSITSENLKDINFSSISKLDNNKIPDSQKSEVFLTSNSREKLKKFREDNVGQSILGMEDGKPKFYYELHAVSVKPLKKDGKDLKGKDGSLIYEGYTNIKDANNGTNRKRFAITGDSITQIKHGEEVETNLGKIKL